MEASVLKGRVNIKISSNRHEGYERTNVNAWVCGPLCIHHSPPLYKRGVYTLSLTYDGIAIVGKMRIARWKLEEMMKLLVEMDGWYAESDAIAENSVLKEAVLPLYKYQSCEKWEEKE